MKCFFSVTFLLFFFSQSLFGKDFSQKYLVKTRGLTIGVLIWELEISEDFYKTSIELKNKGILSSFYKFSGSYVSSGKIIKNNLVPLKYTQIWTTKKKDRNIEISFFDHKIDKLILFPLEKEVPRIEYKKLKGFSDPLTSFLNVILHNVPSYTIDGRRSYLLFPKEIKNYQKVFIQEYTNIWADHKRKDLEFLEIYKKEKNLLPEKIIIKFKGSTFSLNKI